MDDCSSVASQRSSSVHRSSNHHGQSHRNGNGRRHSHGSGHHRNGRREMRDTGHHSGDELLARDEVIQIEILPQDDNWGESTTCVTGNTSERSCSYDDVRRLKDFNRGGTEMVTGNFFGEKHEISVRMRCFGRYLGVVVLGILCTVTFISPVAMVVLPKTPVLFSIDGIAAWNVTDCTPDCEGMLISFSIKLAVLFIGMMVLFMRRFMYYLPRLVIEYALLAALLFMITFAFWLFYGVRIVERREENYITIVSFADSFINALMFVYLAVVVLELVSLRREYKIHVVRSPDGESRTYSVGQLSIQRAATVILQNYYCDFSLYNPFLEKLPGSGRFKRTPSAQPGMDSYKSYDIDGGNNIVPPPVSAQAILAAAARKRDASRNNDRFYDELEWERRVKKRRARLATAVEEAFAHIVRCHEEKVAMDSHEAAQTLFPSFARSLQKYVRITRQHTRHTAESVVRHLSQCLTYDMSPKAFMERFLSNKEQHETSDDQASWSIVCEQMVSRGVNHGTVFQLRSHCQGSNAGVNLLCTVTRLPILDLTEAPFDSKFNKFVLHLNSETSV